MATIITGINQTKVLSNLDTYNHTTLATSMYTVSVKTTELPPSGLTITIQQNGSTKASVSVPAATQNHTELQVVLNCAVSDVIGVILASSVASDVNTIRAILNIHQGSN